MNKRGSVRLMSYTRFKSIILNRLKQPSLFPKNVENSQKSAPRKNPQPRIPQPTSRPQKSHPEPINAHQTTHKLPTRHQSPKPSKGLSAALAHQITQNRLRPPTQPTLPPNPSPRQPSPQNPVPPLPEFKQTVLNRPTDQNH